VKQKRIVIAAAVLAVCIVAGTLFSVRIGAASAPSLFHNDERWYRDSSAGLEIIGEIFYVPVDIFGQFSHIELTVDSRRGEFMVYNRTTKHYITVLYNEKIATVNGEEEIYLNLYRLHGGYYYVPMDYFCSVLSLKCERKATSNAVYGVSVRITDGTQTRQFEDSLSEYDPLMTGQLYPGTTVPPETEKPPETSGNDIVERAVYCTFNTVSADTFYSLLDALRAAEIRAAFFITEEEMRLYPERVISLAASGHTIALTAERAESAEDFLSQMKAANERLFRLVKITARIVQLPGGTERSGFSGEQIDRIAEAGYVLWDWTYDVPDSVGYSAQRVRTLCIRAMESSEVNVLRMSCNRTVTELISLLDAFFETNRNYTVRIIKAAAQEIRFAAAE